MTLEIRGLAVIKLPEIEAAFTCEEYVKYYLTVTLGLIAESLWGAGVKLGNLYRLPNRG